MERIITLIRYYLGDNKEHTKDEVLNQISEIIGGDFVDGDTAYVYGELIKRGVISDMTIIEPNGDSHNTVRLL